ncbi:MAG: ABC transporter substrate-binding protein [Arenicellales bacterium]
MLMMVLGSAPMAAAWTCVYVSSYHKGYAWSDGIERGLRAELNGHCDLIQFDMDTKRNRSELYKTQKAVDLARKIKAIKPEVIIASDDNAARYLIAPYFSGGDIPVVFCGINWTVKEYGFPASNVTGMVEVTAFRPMLDWASKLTRPGARGVYIGTDALSELKDYMFLSKVAAEMGLTIDRIIVDDQQAWMSALEQSNEADFIILGTSSGINGWDEKTLLPFVREHVDKLILTSYRQMMPFAMIGFVKIPEEQGEWAAKTAIAIHEGVPIQRIPIIANRKWEVYENTSLLKLADIEISEALHARAKKFSQGTSDDSR